MHSAPLLGQSSDDEDKPEYEINKLDKDLFYYEL